MTSFRRLSLCALTALLLLSTSLPAQGLSYESVLTGGPFGDKGNVSRTILMPKIMKHINVSDNDFMVLRMDTEKMISVNTKEKTYWETSFAEMEKTMKAASGKMDRQMAEMEAQMKNMPEEQRKMMEQMFGKKMGQKGNPVQLVKSGETKTISGFACTKYVVKEGEKELATIWTTKDVKGFLSLKKDYEALTARMTSMNPGFAKGLMEAMQKVEGFPIQTEWGGFTTLVTKVESRNAAASEFDVPSGYKKIESPMNKLGAEGNEH